MHERPPTRKAAEPRIRGKDYYKRKREARKEWKRQAKREAERTRQRRHSWDDQYNNWREDEEEEVPEVHGSGSEPNETDEERSDSELNSFSAPPNASFGEPHVVEERDGWKRIVVNLDTGAAATAIPSDLNLEGHAKTPPRDISYKTASAESLADEGGVVLRGTDANGSSKILEGWVTGVHRTLASGAKVAKHHHSHCARSPWRTADPEGLQGWKGVFSLRGKALQEGWGDDSGANAQWDLPHGLLDCARIEGRLRLLWRASQSGVRSKRR